MDPNKVKVWEDYKKRRDAAKVAGEAALEANKAAGKGGKGDKGKGTGKKKGKDKERRREGCS